MCFVFNYLLGLMQQSGEGSDITFEVGPEKEILHAHRLVLTTRCDIFYAMFRPGAMRESEAGRVRIEDHSPDMVSKMLEFIYTNRVSDLTKLNSSVRELAFLLFIQDCGRLT